MNVRIEDIGPDEDLRLICESTSISMRAELIAHFKEARGIRIGRDVFIGPGVIVLSEVSIGDGAVVTAGSVVTASPLCRTRQWFAETLLSRSRGAACRCGMMSPICSLRAA